VRNLVEFISTRKISTSYFVALRATIVPTMNSTMPPTSECISEKTAPPEMSATKKSRRSAPSTVSGRFIVLNVLFRRRSPAAICMASFRFVGAH
jgi:hypothetical protein